MAIVAAPVVSSPKPSSSYGSIPFSKFTLTHSFKPRTRITTRTRTRRTSLTWLNPQPCAALVEATPPPPPPSSAAPPSPAPQPSSLRNGSVKVLALPGDRADDLQAEARAMARAANATVYSPQLVASRYGSQPFKVSFCFFQSLCLFANISFGYDWFL